MQFWNPQIKPFMILHRKMKSLLSEFFFVDFNDEPYLDIAKITAP